MLNILNWNVRGVGNTASQNRIRSLKRQHNISLCILQEPMANYHRMQDIKQYLGFGHVCRNVSNKLWVFWDSLFQIHVLEDHDQFIHMEISHPEAHCKFYVTDVYAKCGRDPHKPLWQDLAANCTDNPWMAIGDFNAVSNHSEQINTLHMQTGCMDDFNEALDSCYLFDLGYSGGIFTYLNGKVCRRLDRRW